MFLFYSYFFLRISKFFAIFLVTFKMIRRLLSTFLDYPNAANYGDFFQSSTTTRRFNSWPVENFSFLFELSPVFPLNSKKIRIINEPKDFYDSILRNATNAKHRISLASLYLGIGKLETELVDVIKKNMNDNENLNVNILLDYTRGTRGQTNSKGMLMPLVSLGKKCVLSLYHTPMLRGLTKSLIPARWNELIGIQHMKIYLFDDTVIISGANLSNDYFTNRQDRYIEIEDKKLSDFFSSVIGKVQEFSIQVNENGEECLHRSWKHLPYDGNYQDFASEARRRMQHFFENVFSEQNVSQTEHEDVDTWIFPTLEMGQLSIHHDSIVTKKILGATEKGSVLKMSTGYFNLTQSYMDTIVSECGADCSIIMAHPNANGFKGSKFPSSGIPDAYSLLGREFYQQITKHEEQNRISLLEYERDNWTYHAKGIWYQVSNSSLPCMTLIGSSNYGERSFNRDLEAQICLVTSSEKLQQSLKHEHDHLLKYAKPAEAELTSRVIPNWVKGVVFFFKKFF